MIDAINALDVVNEFAIMLNIDEDEAEGYIIKGYIGIRLTPLKSVPGISKDKINDIADFLYVLYTDYEYSLDTMINAVYNYINTTGTYPSDKLLTDDIETLLDNYAD